MGQVVQICLRVGNQIPYTFRLRVLGKDQADTEQLASPFLKEP